MKAGPLSFLVPFYFMAAILLWPHSAKGQESAASISQHSAEANERDWAAVPEFDNFERDRTKDGDKTYSVTMLEGSPYERLIAVNGKNLTARSNKKNRKSTRRRWPRASTNQPISDPGELPSIRLTASAITHSFSK